MRLIDPHRTVLFRSGLARYAFGLAMVVAALALRLLVEPLTGAGAPFVLFFGATLVTSLVAGVGPAILTLIVSLPVAVLMFVVPAGYPVSQAVFQSLLYSLDGVIIIYLMALMARHRRQTRDTVELAPDAYFLADLNARFTDVNEAGCRLLGCERDELIGMTIFDVIPPEDAERLNRDKKELLVPGKVSTAEWSLVRKDGTLVPVEVSANILPDGRWQAFVRDISERRRVEDLRQVFVSLLDYSSDFIGIADPTGKLIYVNAAGRRMTGLAPDFPVEQTRMQDYYPPELRSFVTDVIVKSMIERGQWSGETQFRNFRTGEPIPVSDTHFMIRDASGKRILGMGTVTRDISEARRIADEREQLLAREQLARQQAESANTKLRESEERFRQTIDNAPIGMALVALDGRFVRVNQVLCEITGYSAEELIGLRSQNVTHPDDVQIEAKRLDALAQGEIPRYQLEKRYVRKDGSVVHVWLSRSVLRSAEGKALYFVTQMEDITARKRAEEGLRLSEAKFSGIISIAADAIISVDKDQRITIFNEGAEMIFGYTKEEAIGTPLERLIPERFRAAHREHFAGFIAGRDSARAMGGQREVFGLRKNGEEFPAEASISKVGLNGSTIFSVVLRDVTYRKSVEQALQRALAARDDVLRIVAHDLRNPLSTIVMQASLLERTGAEPERRDQSARLVITRSAKRMNSLIQDLLDVALVEAGQLKIESARLSAADLAREAVETQSVLASSSELDLRLELGPDIPDVLCDRKRLLQVFENLVGNALKFTPKGGRITVSAAAKDQAVQFAVADTGPGIGPESLPHVFDRFWQAATRERRLGAGLGLPITKGIVEAHGGRIWVESAAGRGTTFFFTIPVAPADAGVPTDGEAEARRQSSQAKNVGQPRRQRV